MKRGWFVQRPGIALAVVNPRQVRDFAHGIQRNRTCGCGERDLGKSYRFVM